jgi:hypothetical protein
MAADLEEKAKNGDAEGIHAKNGKMLAALRTLAGGIRATLKQRSEQEISQGGDGQATLAVSRIEALRLALLRADMKAVNDLLAEHAAMPLPSEVKGKLSAIERDILMFEYNRAITKIEALKSAAIRKEGG